MNDLEIYNRLLLIPAIAANKKCFSFQSKQYSKMIKMQIH